MDANKEELLEKELSALDELQILAEWISSETHKRKYKTEDIKNLSKALVYLREYIEDN